MITILIEKIKKTFYALFLMPFKVAGDDYLIGIKQHVVFREKKKVI
jgi:hypothetical protein